jgi:hypothetical protein
MDKAMKKAIIIFIFAILSNLVFAQEAVKSAAALRKEKRMAEEQKQYELNKTMLDTRNFVLQADNIQNEKGNRLNVNSMINYIAVDSATIVIQTGTDWSLGQNGMGGLTERGRISGWKLTENKKHNSFNLFFKVTTYSGVYDLRFDIGSSAFTSARLTSNRYGELIFEGNLMPYRKSSVFEGQSR